MCVLFLSIQGKSVRSSVVWASMFFNISEYQFRVPIQPILPLWNALIWPFVVIMMLINFDTPLSQVTPNEFQFIQLFTKHEMSLISYHDVWRDLHPQASKSLHPLFFFCGLAFLFLSSGSLFLDGSSPVLKTSLCSSLASATFPDLKRPSIYLAFYKLHYPY